MQCQLSMAENEVEVNEPGLPFEIQNFLPLSPVTKCFFFLTQRNDERGLSSWAHKLPRYLQGGGRMNWGMNGRCCHNNIMDLVVVIIILDYCRIAGRQYYLLWTGLEKNKHYFIQLVVECQFAEQRLRNVGILTRATTRYQGHHHHHFGNTTSCKKKLAIFGVLQGGLRVVVPQFCINFRRVQSCTTVAYYCVCLFLFIFEDFMLFLQQKNVGYA